MDPQRSRYGAMNFANGRRLTVEKGKAPPPEILQEEPFIMSATWWYKEGRFQRNNNLCISAKKENAILRGRVI